MSRASSFRAASLGRKRMFRPTRHVALGLAIAGAALLDVANAWLVRRGHEFSSAVTTPEAAPVMLETQWGSPYFVLTPTRAADGSVEFFFSQGPGTDGGSTGGGGSASGSEDGDANVEEVISVPWDSGTPGSCAAADKSFNKAEAEIFHTVISIETPDLCQEACSNNGRCRAAVHDAQRKVCELARVLRPLTSAPGSTVVLPNCKFSCFKKGQKPNSPGEDIGHAPNPQLCQALCQNKSECLAFSWNGGNGKCFSYSSKGQPEADEKSVWGTNKSCSPNEKTSKYAGLCEEKGMTASFDANLRYMAIDTNDECRNTCYKEKKCQWATFNSKTGICFLKNVRKQVVPSPKDDVTYPKLCDSRCFMKNAALVGKAIAVVPGMKNSFYCHYECWMNRDCQFWHWEGEASKKCNLLGFAAGLISQLSEGHWSGSRGGCHKESEYIAEPNQAGWGILKYYSTPNDWHTSIESVEGLEQCLSWCEGDQRCVVFMYDVDKQICRLSEVVSVVRKDGSGAVSYVGTSSPSTACLKKDFRIEGKGSLIPMPIETAALCHAVCQRVSHCKSFEWSESERSCTIMATGSLEKGSATPGYVSGLKGECYKSRLDIYSYRGTGDSGGSCSHAGVDVDVQSYKSIRATGEKGCNDSCATEYPVCEVYGWNTRTKKCSLHRSIGDGPIASPDNVIGPVWCDSSCLYKGYSYGGAPLVTNFVNVFETPHDCHLKCRGHKDCFGWTHDAQKKTCLLFGAKGSLVLKPTLNVSSGRWGFCGKGTWNVDGCATTKWTTKDSPDLQRVPNVTSLSECRYHCRKEDNCVAVVYSKDRKACFLKETINSLTKEGVGAGEWLAARECADDCFIKDYKFTGNLVLDTKTSYSGQMCAVMCQSMAPQCDNWSYELATHSCILRSGLAKAPPSIMVDAKEKGWISGLNRPCY